MAKQWFKAMGVATALALFPAAAFCAKPLTPARPVAKAAPAALVLPATFAGVLPCADCPGIAQTLTLRADGLYRLRRTYLGKTGEPLAELGRWTAESGGKRLTLRSGADVLYFALNPPTALRLLDRQGKPLNTAANLDLRRTAQVDPISEVLPWRGEFRFQDDVATFTDCASGLRWPLATSADYSTLQRHYLQSGSAPGAPLLVKLEARLEGVPRERMVVNRFVGWPTESPINSPTESPAGATCASVPPRVAQRTVELKDTDWTLVELDGVKIPAAPSPSRAVRITLAGGKQASLTGFGGCNRLVGVYEQNGSTLRFSAMNGTQRACPLPFVAFEDEVLKMLGATTDHRIEGQQLTLLGGAQVLARFAAERRR